MRELLISAAFCLFLTAPWLAGLAGVRVDAVENRRPAARPEWALGSWLDADAYSALAGWLRDVLPLRAQAITLDSWIDFRLLGDSPNRRVLLGREGEIFLNRELGSPCVDGETLDVAALSRLARQLGHHDVDVYLLLSPNKLFLYPELVPPAGVPMKECEDAARREIRKRFRNPLPFTPVELWDVLQAEARAGQRLFPRMGRHWDEYAGIVQARSLVEEVQPGLWDGDAVAETGMRTSAAELPADFMNLAIEETRPSFGVARPGVVVEHREIQLTARSRKPSVRTSALSSGPPVIPGQTLVIHDSFMELSVDAFAAYAESATFVAWSELLLHPDAVAYLLMGANRLVLQVVEDRAAIELGRHVTGMRYVLQRYQALQAHEARLRGISRDFEDTRR